MFLSTSSNLSLNTLLLWGLLHRSQPPPGHSHLLHRGLLHPQGGSSVEICSMGDPWVQGDSLLHQGPLPAQPAGELLLPACSTSCPPAALTWRLQGCFSLLALPASVVQQYFPLLTSALPEVQTTSLIGSALASAGALLELSGAGCCLDCSHRCHPCRPLLPNPCHVNPIEVCAAITKPLCFGLS